jgi:CheY-like chemotaxis protein
MSDQSIVSAWWAAAQDGGSANVARLSPGSQRLATLYGMMETPASRFVGRVLLVEDNPINRLVAGELLDRLGVQFESAEDGAEALQKLDAMPFDLVLMDCLMPRLDGFAATRHWRERERVTGTHTPIIAVTANATAEDRAKCIDAGMDDFLGKPIQMHGLRSLVARYLRAA